jgi:hypothetical protein
MVILPTGLSPRDVREKFSQADISVLDHFNIHVITLVIPPVFIPEPEPEMLLISLESKLVDRLLQLSFLTGIKPTLSALKSASTATFSELAKKSSPALVQWLMRRSNLVE